VDKKKYLFLFLSLSAIMLKRKAPEDGEQPLEKKLRITDGIFPSLSELRAMGDSKEHKAEDDQDYLAILESISNGLKRAAKKGAIRGEVFFASHPPIYLNRLIQLLKEGLSDFDFDATREDCIHPNVGQSPKCKRLDCPVASIPWIRSPSLDCIRIVIWPADECPEPTSYAKFVHKFAQCTHANFAHVDK
jgi:hypothetical protein